jgi:hypothetical protein
MKVLKDHTLREVPGPMTGEVPILAGFQRFARPIQFSEASVAKISFGFHC